VLTLFATPKPFRGHIGTIQRNAITSWTTLRPRPEIILFGNEPGTAEICCELGLRHVPTVTCNESGAPLLSDVFSRAQQDAAHDLLCYVNADIILTSDFLRAIEETRKLNRGFLMVGRVWRVRIEQSLDFHDGWEARLRKYVLERGEQAPPPGNSDYFVFPRGLWTSLPPLALGRGWWDPWMVFEARRLKAAVVDASGFVMAVHQNHDQSSYQYGLRAWRREIHRNYELVGKKAGSFCLWDATHLLTPAGLRPTRGIRYLSRRVDSLSAFYPRLSLPLQLPKQAIAVARALRQAIKTSRNPLYRLAKLVNSKLPPDGIVAILGLDYLSENQKGPRGLQLADGFLMGGTPVMVYDPRDSLMKKAQDELGGPVEFAKSVDECLREADVIVIAAPLEEFRSIATCPAARRSPRCVVIDCCALLERELSGDDIHYVSWRER